MQNMLLERLSLAFGKELRLGGSFKNMGSVFFWGGEGLFSSVCFIIFGF